MINSYHLYLNGKQAHLRCRSGPPWRRRVDDVQQWPWDKIETLRLEPTLPGALLRRPLHAYIGSAFSKFMVTTLPADLHDEREALTIAQAQMQHQFGLDGSAWRFTLDYLPAPAKSIVCALRLDIFGSVQQFAAAQGLSLRSLQPYASQLWNVILAQESRQADNRSLIAMEDDASTVFVQKLGVLESIAAMGHRGDPRVIDREMRRLPYIFGPDVDADIHLGLSSSMAELSNVNGRTHFALPHRPGQDLYADFRDLLFRQEMA